METSGAPDPNSRESILGQVQAALGSDLESLRPVLAQYHHADLAEALQTLDPKTFDTVLHLLDEETRANVFTRIADLDESLAEVGSSRVDLQACKLEYSIVSPK